jgi:hypothetical protein
MIFIKHTVPFHFLTCSFCLPFCVFCMSLQINSEDIDHWKSILDAEEIPQIRRISKTHHVFKYNERIAFRSLSCHCQGPVPCLCHNTHLWEILQKGKASTFSIQGVQVSCKNRFACSSFYLQLMYIISHRATNKINKWMTSHQYHLL